MDLVVRLCVMQKCDAGPGDADYYVEIPRKKGKTVGMFRLCGMHADRVRDADPTATFKELSDGRADEDPGRVACEAWPDDSF